MDGGQIIVFMRNDKVVMIVLKDALEENRLKGSKQHFIYFKTSCVLTVNSLLNNLLPELFYNSLKILTLFALVRV